MGRFVSCLCVYFVLSIFFQTQGVTAFEVAAQKISVLPLTNIPTVEVIAAQQERTLKVNHEIRDGDVYVECLIHPFTFKEEKVGHAHQDGEGHIRLYINEQHIDTIFKPAFIIRGLPAGNHEVKVEVVKNDKTRYDLEESFTVSLPETQ
ncbi:hypothetical protein [Bacillus solitudinis]|uniref:hypothetical protein n=1 Tax=Bacillus solitudinis TaxID=2014074 RepID=UPI000C23A64A|nr:hypothetical protein [Bacillus solitudinis]